MSWHGRVLTVVLTTLFTAACFAQDAAPNQNAYIPREMDDLQQMVAPIALYPDALLAQVLAACTYPDDVIDAAKALDARRDLQYIDAQPWDSSVKGVARYPTVLRYLASNADWMNDLGDAFLNQQADVMTAVQNLRAEARAAGTLTDTPQQSIIDDGGTIQIIPADPQMVYAPIYDPQVVYAAPAYAPGSLYAPYITFSAGVAVGDWLDFDLDWHDHAIYSGHWGRDRPWWHYDRSVGHHYIDVRPGVYRPGAFRDHAGHSITVAGNRWARDVHKPPPRAVHRTIVRPDVRPARGYSGAGGNTSNYGWRTDVTRQSERGRQSRERAAVVSPRAAAPHSAARAAPSHVVERPSAPVRGGAVHGYEGGGAASHSASRGAASRGRH